MKQTRLIKFNALLLLAGLCVMGSCAEDELPAPMKKARTVVKFTADWSECASAAPVKYTVRMGNDAQEVTGNVNNFLLSSTSDYSMVAYNEPQGIIVSGNTATLNEVGISTRGAGASVTSLPDDFFSVAGDLKKDELMALTGDTLRLTFKMKQRTRQVNLMIKAGTRPISSASGVLENVVAGIDLITGEATSVANTIVNFTASQAADGAQQLSGVMRLLGVSREEERKQTMTMEVVMQDGGTTEMTADLTEMLAHIEEGGNRPLELQGTVSGGISGDVMDWQIVEKGDISFNN